MNGMIRTVVSGNADKAVQLLKGDVFHKDAVVVLESPAPETLYEQMTADTTSIFVVKVKHARINHYSGPWTAPAADPTGDRRRLERVSQLEHVARVLLPQRHYQHVEQSPYEKASARRPTRN